MPGGWLWRANRPANEQANGHKVCICDLFARAIRSFDPRSLAVREKVPVARSSATAATIRSTHLRMGTRPVHFISTSRTLYLSVRKGVSNVTISEKGSF